MLPKTGTKANRSLNSDFGILDYQTDGDDSQELRHQLNRNMKSNQNLDCLSETEAGNESQPDEDQLDEEMEEETDQDEDRLATADGCKYNSQVSDKELLSLVRDLTEDDDIPYYLSAFGYFILDRSTTFILFDSSDLHTEQIRGTLFNL